MTRRFAMERRPYHANFGGQPCQDNANPRFPGRVVKLHGRQVVAPRSLVGHLPGLVGLPGGKADVEAARVANSISPTAVCSPGEGRLALQHRQRAQ